MHEQRSSEQNRRVRGRTHGGVGGGVSNGSPYPMVVVAMRDAVGTISSILRKGWFSHQNNAQSLIWPFRVYKSVHVPFWVRDGEEEVWVQLSELDRAAYYYIRMNEGAENLKGHFDVKYSALLKPPLDVIHSLAERLGLKFGAMTEKIIQQVQPMRSEQDESILTRIDSSLRKSVEYYSELSS